jgi:FtsP/CotA-like multicopper oxidase with cupredoxin domain
MSLEIHERPGPVEPFEAPGTSETERSGISRRMLLRAGAIGAGVAGVAAANSLLAPSLAGRGLWTPDGVFGAAAIAWADNIYTEAFPTSPLILSPFTDPLNVPKTQKASAAYTPAKDKQNSYSGNNAEKHQIWYDDPKLAPEYQKAPIVYQLDVKIDKHSFTSSQVQPINSKGQPAVSYDTTGKPTDSKPKALPPSTRFQFNGGLPRINTEYGQPVCVRFNNILDQNPDNLDVQDFGAPDRSFLTHLHNGHTAPESDGNPHYSMNFGPKGKGYPPGTYVDNLYLNWPAGGDDREKQSFFWFHDHRMDHTGSNVYKGCVGMFPIYDPKLNYNGTTGRYDAGNEKEGLRLPGVRTDNPDGTFDVDYDIPMAFTDYRFDDGVTLHNDIHDSEHNSEFGVLPGSSLKTRPNPNTHPEWWGKTFYRHFPNHGFVGDVLTVNGTAYPVFEVKRRKYRLRFLDASISRIYEFKLMSSTGGPKAAKDLNLQGDTELQGQYRIPDGQQCMKFVQIANDGGLLPFPVTRDSFELWPAKRREFIVDFTRYQDGSPTKKGDVIYLTNVMKMPDGRMWSNSSRFSPDPNYKVPVIKIVIGDDAPDDSVMPSPTTKLRDLPDLPSNWKNMLNDRLVFEVKRGSAGGETEWLINGIPFDPTKPETSLKNPNGKTPLAQQPKGSFNVWEIRNGGGGWVHPFHLHMEEHRTVMRNGKDVTATGSDPAHPDDIGREDLVALDPSESTIIYRGFRDFNGKYVAHCHNLAHEDHAMMFGWEIV